MCNGNNLARYNNLVENSAFHLYGGSLMNEESVGHEYTVSHGRSVMVFWLQYYSIGLTVSIGLTTTTARHRRLA